MSTSIKIRMPDDLWYTEIPWNKMLGWDVFEVTYIDDSVCFVNINGTKMELKRSDYDRLKIMKPVNLKFNIKKLKL